MKRLLCVFLLIVTSAFSKVDYSSMSTEELLAMIGYVPSKNIKTFKKELDKRFSMMNKKEKTIYFKNLKKMKR